MGQDPIRSHEALQSRQAKVMGWLVFGLSLLPLLWLMGLAWLGRLGANPVETLSHRTGDWALRFLLLTLALTPLRQITGWDGWRNWRRMLGLFGFFYACLHVGVYLGFDQFFDVAAIMADIAGRPYLTAGFIGWLLLIPLALTSTRGMMRRLGRHWPRLHRLAYPAAALGVLHYGLLAKTDTDEPLLYAVILAGLLAYRLWLRQRTRSATVRCSQ